MTPDNGALSHLLQYPLFEALFKRRSRRISKGLPDVLAGSLTYHSEQPPQPLSPLEEAILIVTTGVTGLTMPDQPFKTERGKDLVGTPMLEIMGRAASSPDNAQSTHFFLINDSGTYLLRAPPDGEPPRLSPDDPQSLVDHAERCKVKVLDRRLDFPRQFPYYFGRNRYVSNVPGSTLLVPVIDMTRQYINQFMYLLCQDDGYRPVFLDDWNFYRLAGVRRWVKNGFLNPDLKVPIGFAGTFRIHVEADLLIQNLLLVLQAMGLGGWVHAAFTGPYLLGSPEFSAESGPGLGFRFLTPRKFWRRTVLKAITPLPAWQPNPVGLDGLLEGYCPPYYPDMPAAVDALLRRKYGPTGIYRDQATFDQIFQPGLGARFLEEVPHYTPDTIACCKDICSYIYDTYGRFPAHVDAMYVPGVWVQAHHLDLEYYDQWFRQGYTDTHAHHEARWHAMA